MGTRRPAALLLIVVAMLAAASPAAADRIYFGSHHISFANLGGGGGGELATPGASSESPEGIAIDPAAGRIYWARGSGSGSQIAVADLDGSGGEILPITGAPLNYPKGVALDLSAGRVYWANYQGAATERIGFANLDGSGGGFLNTTGASTAPNPTGTALDPAANRIYWSNENGEISYANLDGSGGGEINTTGATGGVSASGVAVDRAGGRIYWVSDEGTIPYPAYLSYANLDGSGGGDVPTALANSAFPVGIAVDHEADRIYWANTTAGLGTATISFSSLVGGSSQDLNLDGAPSQAAKFPTLLKAPLGTEAPKLTAGISARPRFLICDEGKWAGDLPEAQLYRAPHSVSYQWVKDGQPVPGATRSDIGVDGRPGGDYACQVTATNAAGSTTQTSRVQFVCCPVGPKATAARVALVKGGRAQLRLTCPEGVEPCAGGLHLESTRPPRRRAGASARKGPKIPNLPVVYGERSISIPGGDQQVVKVTLSRRAKSQLRKSKRHRLRAVLDGRAVVSRTVLLKLAPKRERAQ